MVSEFVIREVLGNVVVIRDALLAEGLLQLVYVLIGYVEWHDAVYFLEAFAEFAGHSGQIPNTWDDAWISHGALVKITDGKEEGHEVETSEDYESWEVILHVLLIQLVNNRIIQNEVSRNED